MDEALLKSGQWPNVAEPAGSNPAEVMRKYGRKPPSVFATDEPEPQRARFGEWVDSQDDDGAVDEPGVDSRERLEADLIELTRVWYDYDGNFMKIYSHVAYAQVKELLDRQAAITERETKLRELYRFEENHREHIRSIEEANQRLNERVGELTAELGAYRGEYEKYELVLPLDEIMKYTADPPGWIKKCIAELTAERDELQDVVRKQAESFKRLEIDLKCETDTCNTLRASVAGLKLTVDKLQGELDALRASGR